MVDSFESTAEATRQAISAVITGVATNAALAIIKIITGVLGHSNALIADGIESITDVVSATVVWSGLRIAARPADANHPYGHGKAEPLAALVVSLALLVAATIIAIQSLREIWTPHQVPAAYTLVVLLGVIMTKEVLFRVVGKVGDSIHSVAVRTEAWHHRSDAITSIAAFIGISIALIGGKGYESADDWAALLACGIIGYNGIRLLRQSLAEIMDETPGRAFENRIRAIAKDVPGVKDIEKCRVRKSGLAYLVDLHVIVDGEIPVRAGHELAHRVKDRLCQSEMGIQEVTVHIEPDMLVPSSRQSARPT